MPRSPQTPRRPRLIHARRWAAAAGGVLCLLIGTSGCSGPERVDVEGFAPGPCQDAATTVEDIDETLLDAEAEDLGPREAGDRLKAAQDELKPIRDAATDPLGQTVTDLITALGFFRISVDSNNYDGSQIADVRTALDALVQRCNA